MISDMNCIRSGYTMVVIHYCKKDFLFDPAGDKKEKTDLAFQIESVSQSMKIIPMASCLRPSCSLLHELFLHESSNKM